MAEAWEFRAYDVRQVRLFFDTYYDTESHFESTGEDKSVRAVFKGAYTDRLCHSAVMLSTPFRCVWRSRSAFTVVSGVAGEARVAASGQAFTLAPRLSACLSPDTPIEMDAASRLSLRVARFDTERVQAICSAWLGTPLDRPPRFEGVPFSPALEAQWARILDCIASLDAAGGNADWTARALEDYAIGLLVSAHPHNLSRFIDGETGIDARAAAAAHAFITDNAADALTPTGVAEALDHSLPALSRGFREHRGISLRRAIHMARANRIDDFASPARQDEDSRLVAAKLEQLRLHILGSLSRPLRTVELAAMAGMSANQLRTLFRQAFALTPSQYVLRERVNWAQHLLTHSRKSIAQIADETGFSSQAHLNTVFRRQLGFTPGELRKSV